VAVVLLILIGAVTPDQLAEKRRYAILVAFIIGAIFTPPDILSQFMMAIPVWFLYELGILIGRVLLRRQGGPLLGGEPDDDGPEPPSGGSTSPSAPSAPAGDAERSERTATPRDYETERDEDFDFDRAFDEIERDQQSLDQAREDDDTGKTEENDQTERSDRDGDDRSDADRNGRH